MATASLEPAGSLADRLRSFRFEEPGAPAFSDCLAQAVGWQPLYAQRVVEEYRRFLWLAVTSAAMVSPSPDVDEAWHLHLLDTRSYWDRLCPFVLGRPLHHVRSRGGGAEHQRFHAAYARTLEAYRHAFGEPPDDIWPPVESLRGRDDRAIRPAIGRRAARALALVAAMGCGVGASAAGSYVLTALRWIFEASDPIFVGTLAALAVGLQVIGGVLRRRARGPSNEPSEAELAALDRYDVAYLADGPRSAVEVAVTELVGMGVLAFDAEHRRLRPGREALAQVSDVQSLVLDAVRARPRGTVVEQLPSDDRVRALLQQNLVDAGLLVPPAPDRQRAAWVGGGVAVLAALDLVKLVIGVRHHATTGLPFLCWQPLLASALWPLAAGLGRTRRGDAALAALRAAFELPPAGTSPAEDFATLVSLFGAPALGHSTLAELAKALRPPPPASSPACGCGG